MIIGMIGLGKMGANMARRLLSKGISVAGYDHDPRIGQEMSSESGAFTTFTTVQDLIASLPSPKIVWVMVPSGQPTEDTIHQLGELLARGDIVIDGGNSNFNDSMRRAKLLEDGGIFFLDVGVSGGVWGLKEGYSLMIGGDEAVAASLAPLFEALAPAADAGWGRVGPSGAGHFTKMVHNGIEYGLMEAYAEGFELLKARKDFTLDLSQVASIWQQGSVVRSWLLDLTAAALEQDPDLKDIRGWVADSGEGRWTVFEAVNLDVPAPVITLSLFRRFESRQDDSYATKLLAAMRNQFGGHAVKKAGD